jgi:four helix bundle protein
MQERKYDLEDRTLNFAKNCIDLCKALAQNRINTEIVSQLVKASSSIGANYREARNSMAKRDFFHRIGISSREAKEAKYWLELLLHSNTHLSARISPLIDEAFQLTKTFSSISKKNI